MEQEIVQCHDIAAAEEICMDFRRKNAEYSESDFRVNMFIADTSFPLARHVVGPQNTSTLDSGDAFTILLYLVTFISTFVFIFIFIHLIFTLPYTCYVCFFIICYALPYCHNVCFQLKLWMYVLICNLV